MQSNQKEDIQEAVNKLVSRILERGRLHQLEIQNEIGVRDGGVELAKINFAHEILSLARTEASSLGDKIIGKYIVVRSGYKETNDDTLYPNEMDKAVRDFQKGQRAILDEYINPQVPKEVADNVPVAIDKPIDRNKPAIKLEGFTGREENSLMEE